MQINENLFREKAFACVRVQTETLKPSKLLEKYRLSTGARSLAGIQMIAISPRAVSAPQPPPWYTLTARERLVCYCSLK